MPDTPNRSPMHLALRSAIQVDATLFAPVAGAITAIPVVVLFALGLRLCSPVITSGLALGALFVGLASRIGGPRLPASTMLLDTIGLAASAFVGAACSGLFWLHFSTLVLWCFTGGLLVALGPGRSVIGIQGVMAMIVFGRAPQSLRESAALALVVLIGGTAQTTMQLLIRVPVGLRTQRRAIGDVFTQLAGLARHGPRQWSTSVARSIDNALATLDSAALFGRTDVQALRSMADEARRMRLELIAIDGLLRRLPDRHGAARSIERAREQLGLAMEEVAKALTAFGSTGPPAAGGRPSVWSDLSATLETFGAAEAGAPDAGDLTPAVVRHFRSLAGQLRAATRLVAQATDVRFGSLLAATPSVPRPMTSELRRAWGLLAENLTSASPAFRHAIRLAVIVPALDIAAQHAGLSRSYWVPLSAAVVLRPDYVATLTRGLARMGGTVVGVGTIGALVGGLHPGVAATVALAALTGWGAFTFYQSSYGIGVAFLTGLVLLLVTVGQPGSPATAGYRLLDSVIGGSVALVAYLLWPTWSKEEAQQLLTRLVASQRRYVAAVLEGFTAAGPTSPEDLRALGRTARLAYTDAQSAVGRSLAEPRARRIDPEVSRGILAALRRLIRAAHSLRTEMVEGADIHGMEDFADAVDHSLSTVEDGMADAMRVLRLLPLRSIFHQIDPAGAGSSVPLPVAIQLDEVVNAIDTVAVLMGASDPDAPS
jgi:uncharacterized membrane protein YccC